MLQVCFILRKYSKIFRMKSTSNKMSSFAELFPTKTSFVVFISYMSLFINQGKHRFKIKFVLFKS